MTLPFRIGVHLLLNDSFSHPDFHALHCSKRISITPPRIHGRLSMNKFFADSPRIWTRRRTSCSRRFGVCAHRPEEAKVEGEGIEAMILELQYSEGDDDQERNEFLMT
jgi:hypothetical protein